LRLLSTIQDADPEVIAPVFLEEQDGTVLADPWAEGFMEAVRRP
jgi:hypothetical protein